MPDRWSKTLAGHSAQNGKPGRRPAGLPGKNPSNAIFAVIGLTLLVACAESQTRTDAPGLRVGDVLGGDAVAAAFARADAPRAFRFPADHGAHPQFRSEWWYLTLALRDAGGREFGVQFTVFRQAANPGGAADDPWRNGQAYLGHFAVTDVRAGLHREAERLSRGHPALAFAWAGGAGEATNSLVSSPEWLKGSNDLGGSTSVGEAFVDPTGGESTDSALLGGTGGFVVWLEGWQLSGIGGAWRLVADAEDMAASIDLTPTKPVVLQGDLGLSTKGPGQASYYYSVPRLQASGNLRINGTTHEVEGDGWLDREWSTSVLGPHQAGWDWFALMLDNGEDIMAFRLRRDDGARDQHDHGVLVDAAGRARRLGIDDFHLKPVAYWRDDHGTAWPTGWVLTLDDREFDITASVEDQRMDTLLTYWEGLVHVRDPLGERIGRGYMELTGYR